MLFVSAMWVGKNFLTVKMAKNFPPLHVNFFVAMMRKNLLFYYGKQSEKFVGFN
jgi:hypothetical protein